MYKSKLQELCHHRAWSLPEYITTREGPPHNSLFHCFVNVNGIAFSSSAPAKTSKSAQNDAALVAYTRLSSSATAPVNKLSSGEGTAMQRNAPILQTDTHQNAPEIGQTLRTTMPQNAREISRTLQTSTQQNELASSHTLQSLCVGLAADLGGLVENSPQLTAPETDLANKGVSGDTSIGNESSTVTNELCNSGLTMPKAVGASQTQENRVAIKSGIISPRSSTLTYNLINNSGVTTESAKETSQTQGSGVLAIVKNDSSSKGKTPQLKEPETKLVMRNESIITATVDNNSMELLHLSKNQLQSYTQKRCLSFPVYYVEYEGPPHAIRFRCKVVVDGRTFGSEEFYPNLNKAEAAAARIALLSLLPNGVEEDDFGYKNRLQELVQKSGYLLPTYSTSKYGEDHTPTFVSKVEIGGECFLGQEAKNKKRAESNAAKIAYTTIKQRNLLGEETKQLVSHKRSDPAGNPNENLACLPPSPKRQEVQFSSSINRADYIAFLRQNVQPSMPVPEKEVEVFPVLDQSSTSKSHSSTSGTSFSSTNELSQSPTAFASNSSSSSTICSSIEHLIKASKTCKIGVVVHPCQSSVSYPSSSNVLPISSNDWVAVKYTTDSNK